MQIKLGSITVEPPVLLAPLAGITDLPFRNLVSSFGAGLVVSEMVASHEFITNRTSARDRAELGLERDQTAIQIAGRNPKWMAMAARMMYDNGAKIIDINMGCPAKKVTNGYSGSALMRDLDHALTLIDAVVGAVPVPVTLKTRLGWDDTLHNAPELAKRAQDAGVQMITIHGRTRCQFYKGRADWSAISNVKKAVSIPVIANGDIVDTPSAAQAMNDAKSDGVMVGRGAQGRPWLLAQISHDLFGTPKPVIPSGRELVEMIAQHYSEMVSFYDAKLGVKVARKHLGWYMDDAHTPKALRQEILTETNPDRVLKLIPHAFDQRTAA